MTTETLPPVEETPAVSRKPRATTIGISILSLAVIVLAGSVLLLHSQESARIARQQTQISNLNTRLDRVGTLLDGINAQMASVKRTSTQASRARLGLCVAPGEQSNDSYGDTFTALQSWDLTSPSTRQGVVTCPSGQFMSVVPGH